MQASEMCDVLYNTVIIFSFDRMITYGQLNLEGSLIAVCALQDDDSSVSPSLVTARKTRRWATPHALKNRSKYAVRPRDAVELGNHFVWELAPGATAHGVAPDRALLHHYRVTFYFTLLDSD